MDRELHRVTCKVALYDKSKHYVLLAEYKVNEFGIPGGHLEKDEEPDATIKRELKEELNIDYDGPLVRKDFWIHNDGKVILGFVGELDMSTSLIKEDRELRSLRWTKVSDIKDGNITAGTYDKFIIENSTV